MSYKKPTKREIKASLDYFKALGYKKDSMLVGHVDKVRDVNKYSSYMCKHISRDSAYGILA